MQPPGHPLFPYTTLFRSGAFRLAPEVLKWLDRKGERGHELAMQDKALEFEKLRGATRMAEITAAADAAWNSGAVERSEEHTSELQSRPHRVCRPLRGRKE